MRKKGEPFNILSIHTIHTEREGKRDTEYNVQRVKCEEQMCGAVCCYYTNRAINV